MSNKVPWTTLFPGLDHYRGIFRDSVRRENGDRHYRVKLRLPHRTLDNVRRKLEPYGFMVERWEEYDPWSKKTSEMIKCIRRTPAAG